MSGIALVYIGTCDSVETRLAIKLKELPFELSIKNINANSVCFLLLNRSWLVITNQSSRRDHRMCSCALFSTLNKALMKLLLIRQNSSHQIKQHLPYSLSPCRCKSALSLN
jgi:hypothetical protein